MFGKCRGCQAKDEEIRHLLSLLTKSQDLSEKAQARLAEIVSPGAERRMVLAVSPPKPMPPTPPLRRQHTIPGSFPGYAEREVPPPPPITEDGNVEDPS